MKRGSRKLALQRETLVTLTPDTLDGVLGAITTYPTLPQTKGLSVCPSQSFSVCPQTRNASFCPSQVICVTVPGNGGNNGGDAASAGGK